MQKENPKVFDPEKEVKNILTVSDRQERKRKLEAFKEALVFQKEGVVKIQEEIESLVGKNPSISAGELKEFFNRRADEFSLSELQREIGLSAIEESLKRHSAIREAREHFDDSQLFENLFSRKPLGKIEVIEDFMTLTFVCHDLRDYAWIRSPYYKLSGISEGLTEGLYLDEEDIKNAGETNGAYLETSIIPSLSGRLIAINASGKELKSSKAFKGTLEHEKQHAKKALFPDVPESHSLDVMDLANSQSEGEGKRIIRKMWLPILENAEFKAKDELLAYFQYHIFSEPTVAEKDIRQTLLDIIKEYNFMKIGEIFKKIIKSSESVGPSDSPFVRALKGTSEEFQAKLEKDVLGGVSAFIKLRRDGMSISQATTLLTHEPLEKWPKTAMRVSEIRSKQKETKSDSN